jgi:23S rRNA (uridine2552-2'-O)-methyltransferase
MREVQDHWFREAKAKGYRSRAAFKLLEIDRRRPILRSGAGILDCGAAPGSWLQVAAERVGPRGRVVGVDLKAIDPGGLPAWVTLVEADLRECSLGELGGRPFEVVLSDMAPDTTGDPGGDQARSARLVNDLLDRLGEWLRPGGALVYKVFEGGDYPPLLRRTQSLFARAKGFKPTASRAESVEMFVIAEGFRPAAGESGAEDPSSQPATPRLRGWSR